MATITKEMRDAQRPINQAHVQFTTDPVARNLIRKIVTRAISIYAAQEVKLDRMSTEMDLSAVHANGNPLNFDRLLAFDDFNLMHDITGIYINLDRETGKLMNFFSPRSTAQTSPSFPRGAGVSQTEAEVRAKRRKQA